MRLLHRPYKVGTYFLVVFLPALVACSGRPVGSALSAATAQPTSSASPAAMLDLPGAQPASTSTPAALQVRVAVIGDYGMDNQAEADVAALVLSWQPDLIITTGDNNYPSGSASSLDANVGRYFHDFIAPYNGAFGSGAETNRFFPTLGNHDWAQEDARAYLDYFTLPGNERYYDVIWGPLHFFALDSDWHEPDGVGISSRQSAWLQERLAASTAPWQLVCMHHPPYSSGRHGSILALRWPFDEWGVEAVLAGHDHTYEKLLVDGVFYFVNGLGGAARYGFPRSLAGSLVRYNQDYGAMLVTAGETSLLFEFYNRSGEIIDHEILLK